MPVGDLEVRADTSSPNGYNCAVWLEGDHRALDFADSPVQLGPLVYLFCQLRDCGFRVVDLLHLQEEGGDHGLQRFVVYFVVASHDALNNSLVNAGFLDDVFCRILQRVARGFQRVRSPNLYNRAVWLEGDHYALEFADPPVHLGPLIYLFCKFRDCGFRVVDLLHLKEEGGDHGLQRFVVYFVVASHDALNNSLVNAGFLDDVFCRILQRVARGFQHVRSPNLYNRAVWLEGDHYALEFADPPVHLGPLVYLFCKFRDWGFRVVDLLHLQEEGGDHGLQRFIARFVIALHDALYDFPVDAGFFDDVFYRVPQRVARGFQHVCSPNPYLSGCRGVSRICFLRLWLRGLFGFSPHSTLIAPCCLIAWAPRLWVGAVGREIPQYNRRGGATAIACRRVIPANRIYFLGDARALIRIREAL